MSDDFDIFDELSGGEDKNRYRRQEPEGPAPQPNYNPNPSITDPRTRGAVDAAFKHSYDNIVNARANGKGRNNELNTEAFNLGQLVASGLVTEEQVREHLTAAANASGLDVDPNCGPSGIRATIASGLTDGIASGPRTNLPKMDQPISHEVVLRRGISAEVSTPDIEGDAAGKPGPGARILTLRSMADVPVRIPEWAWFYNGAGRIQLGTMAIFGGLPGTGKSTAARWFVSQATRGELEGCWYGQEVNCAYIAAEEDIDAMVAPSLIAGGANIERVFYPEVVMNEHEVAFMSKADELQLTDQMCDQKVKLLVVDPIMSTLGGSIDIHKNNEVREYLAPYLRIAHAIDGVVIGIAHFRKNGAGSAVQALTGSGAFGEVTRSVFGFAKTCTAANDGEDIRVMSQSKNSAGREDLAVQYRLDLVPVRAADGRQTEMTKFVITGDSEITVEDIMAEGADVHSKGSDARAWLHDFLMMNGPTASKAVKVAARSDTDFSESTLMRAMRALKVVVENRSIDGKPRVSFWRLPDAAQSVPDSDWTDGWDGN
jgi:hypothetical protein